MNIKSKFLVVLFAFLTPLIIFADSSNIKEEFQVDLSKAKVLEIVEVIQVNTSSTQVLKIELLSGDFQGSVALIRNSISGSENQIELKVGSKISVYTEVVEGKPSFYFHSLDKTNSLLILVSLFILAMIAFGGMKGIKALLSLSLTIALILFGLVPLLLEGYNPIILSVLTCIIAAVLTFVITNGLTKKALVAIIGVSGGLVIGGLIAYVFGHITHVSGISTENAQMLQYLPQEISLDYKGLLFAGIIIGALGACMDVAIELTSSLIEIKRHQPNISEKELIKSGYTIGKDIMGTMVNTLILAYTGGSLATILIFTGFEKSFSEIINLDSITTEIIRAISGSMGLLFAIPFTILTFIIVYRAGEDKDEKIN